jgi:NAD(P)-dependent dehydrogenase (short-subunit alcohol dehydrogenase family)
MPTVLVTGTSRGLGLEFARQYAADGWDVIACARTPEKAIELRKLADASNGRIAIHKLDVTDFPEIDALAKQLSGRAIDVLINCAGAMGRSTPFGSTNYAEWEQLFRLNAFASMKMSEAFITHVARSEQKKIISITTLMASLADNQLGGFYAYRTWAARAHRSNPRIASRACASSLPVLRRSRQAVFGYTTAAKHPGSPAACCRPGHQVMPSIRFTSCTCERTLHLRNTRFTWVFTVFTDNPSSLATSAKDLPV